MKALVVYDSAYGNTEQVAQAIAKALAADAAFLRAADAKPADLEGVDLLIVGSPTQGGRPTAAVQAFLRSIPDGGLKGTAVTAFDTRIGFAERGLPLRLLMKVIGFATGRIAGALARKGGRLLVEPEGFVVEDKEGPLASGELERAERWASRLPQRLT